MSLKDYALAVANYEYDVVDTIPDKLVTKETSSSDFIWYCYALLSVAEGDMFRYVMDLFEEMNFYSGLHIINQVLLDQRSNIDVVRKLRLYVPELSHVELISELTEQPFSDSVMLAIDKLITVFGIPDYNVLKEMMVELEAKEQYEFYNFIFNYASEISDYAPIPEWIDNTKIVTEQELQRKEMELHNPERKETSVEELASDIADLVGSYSQTPIENITSALRNSSQEDIKSISTVMSMLVADKKQQNSSDLIKYFGPSNPLRYPFDYASGQDRMLLSTFFDHDPVTGDEEDWFTGSCGVCGLRIRKRHHAIRMPLVQGAWEGCFCSIKCLEQYTQERYYLDSDYIKELIALYSAQMHEHKIYERE